MTDGYKIKRILTWVNGEEKQIYPASRLPSAYQEVEYIECTGTQYINSGYTPSTNSKIQCKFAHNEHIIDTPVFGCRYNIGNTNNEFILWSHPSEYGGNSIARFNYNPGPSHNLSEYPQGTEIEFYYDNSGGKYGSQTWTWTAASGNGRGPLYIFGLNNTDSGVDSRKFSGKLWYFKISESGTLVRDLVPCYRKSDNVIGMYDIVNNQFYTNSGSGTFTKGPDVS